MACIAALPLRFQQKIAPAGECWTWTGGLRYRGPNGGYGGIQIGRRHVPAHRAVYELLVGPIPIGMDLDHVCHNQDPSCGGGGDCLHRRCVNPDHLEVVTKRINILRGHGMGARHARQTHCSEGHVLTLHTEPAQRRRGRRTCAVCREAHRRERRRRQRESKKWNTTYLDIPT